MTTEQELAAMLALPLYFAGYRGSESKHLSHHDNVVRFLPSSVSKVLVGSAGGEISYRWEDFGRGGRHQVADVSRHVFRLRPDWWKRVPEDYWLVERKLVLDLVGKPRPGKAIPARWVEQARGANLKAVDGILVLDSGGEGHLVSSEQVARRRGLLTLHGGRASVESRLAVLERSYADKMGEEEWRRFYAAAVEWMMAVRPRGRKIPVLRGALLAVEPSQQSRELERHLHWLLRAVWRGPVQELERVRDWVLARRPSLEGVSWEEARRKASAWHDSLWSAAALESEEGAAPPGWLLMRQFKTVKLDLPEGWTWRTGAPPEAWQQVGRILGHCYRELSVLTSYQRSQRMYVLFDPAGNPHVTAGADLQSITQVLGASDRPPKAEFHPMIWPWVALIGAKGGKGKSWEAATREWALDQREPGLRFLLRFRGWLGAADLGVPAEFELERERGAWFLTRARSSELLRLSGIAAPWMVRARRAAPTPWQMGERGWLWRRRIAPRATSLQRAAARFEEDGLRLQEALAGVRWPRWMKRLGELVFESPGSG